MTAPNSEQVAARLNQYLQTLNRFPGYQEISTTLSASLPMEEQLPSINKEISTIFKSEKKEALSDLMIMGISEKKAKLMLRMVLLQDITTKFLNRSRPHSFEDNIILGNILNYIKEETSTHRVLNTIILDTKAPNFCALMTDFSEKNKEQTFKNIDVFLEIVGESDLFEPAVTSLCEYVTNATSKKYMNADMNDTQIENHTDEAIAYIENIEETLLLEKEKRDFTGTDFAAHGFIAGLGSVSSPKNSVIRTPEEMQWAQKEKDRIFTPVFATMLYAKAFKANNTRLCEAIVNNLNVDLKVVAQLNPQSAFDRILKNPTIEKITDYFSGLELISTSTKINNPKNHNL